MAKNRELFEAAKKFVIEGGKEFKVFCRDIWKRDCDRDSSYDDFNLGTILAKWDITNSEKIGNLSFAYGRNRKEPFLKIAKILLTESILRYEKELGLKDIIKNEDYDETRTKTPTEKEVNNSFGPRNPVFTVAFSAYKNELIRVFNPNTFIANANTIRIQKLGDAVSSILNMRGSSPFAYPLEVIRNIVSEDRRSIVHNLYVELSEILKKVDGPSSTGPIADLYTILLGSTGGDYEVSLEILGAGLAMDSSHRTALKYFQVNGGYRQEHLTALMELSLIPIISREIAYKVEKNEGYDSFAKPVGVVLNSNNKLYHFWHSAYLTYRLMKLGYSADEASNAVVTLQDFYENTVYNVATTIVLGEGIIKGKKDSIKKCWNLLCSNTNERMAKDQDYMDSRAGADFGVHCFVQGHPIN